MSTHMPIAQRIVNGIPFSELADMEAVGIFSREIPSKIISSYPLFDIQIAAELARAGQSFEKGVEIIHPPYPLMWAEWTVPQRVRDKVMPVNMACALSHSDMINDQQLPSGWNFVTYLGIAGQSKWACPGIGINIKLDKLGRYSTSQSFVAQGRPNFLRDSPETEAWLKGQLTVCVVALSLMNCKNVTTSTPKEIGFRRTGSEKRRGIPARKIKYHTIILPGGGSQSDGQGGHRATALHRVRGHFKTFTAEKPLMGKHVGTYWWGWQVRGNAEKGMVVSDYTLEGAS